MSGGWATLAFLIFGFIILAYLLLQIYDRLRNDARQQPAEAPQLRAGVDELVRELRQAAEQINADMTSRANTLQKLVDDANEALKRLDAAAQRASMAPSAHKRSPTSRIAAPRAAAGREQSELPRPRATSGVQAAESRGGSGRTPATAPQSPAGRVPSERGTGARERSPAAQSASPSRPAPPRPAPVPNDGSWPGAPAGAPSVQIPRVVAASPAAASAYRQSTGSDPFVGVDLADTGRFQTVRRLSEQGMSAGEIARSIGLGREEVELIMRVGGEAAS